MISIDGRPILSTEYDILMTLRSQLIVAGIDRLRDVRPNGNNIMITCPVHKNGMESRPSCGVLTVSRGKYGAGTWNCLTCGAKGSFENLVSICFNRNDGGLYGRQWLVKNFIMMEVEDRKPIDIYSILKGSPKREISYVSEEELQSYRYIHPYMYERKLTDNIIYKFDVGYDANFKLLECKFVLPSITFPVRDITGQTLFIARRAINQKIFNYPSNVDKPIYGIYELSEEIKHGNSIDTVIICESIINALTCWSHGKYAVALNGTGSGKQYEMLKKMNVKKFILALDPDEAGIKGRSKLRKELSSTKLISEYILPEGKDINDLSIDEFNNLEERFV